ncbi:MAG: hypothetical protein GF308_03770 [Candidatus Heimdallarchaeota archaeon]|nr:hypothetical protein [Candidatus Heimdallarchaeota archaeon]
MNKNQRDQEKIERTNGVGSITFEKIIRTARIRSPLEDFAIVEQPVEYRKDPLTNHLSRINALRAERVKQASSADNPEYIKNIEIVIEKSGQKCFFCPENLLSATPCFPEELNVGKRITIGDFSLFPNLFVFSQYHAVGTLGREHFTPLNKFSKEVWAQAIEGSQRFFQAVYDYDAQAQFPSINFNFLPPSASSIVHPHIQIIQDAQPTELTAKLLQASRKYTENGQERRNYWLDLISSEKQIKKRFIFENEYMAWLASFSPFGKNEIIGIVKSPTTDILQITQEDIVALGEGISTALKAVYLGRGVRSVNMAMYFGPINVNYSDSYRIHLRIVSRPTLMPNYTGDIGFMELLHSETIGEATPEVIASSLKEHFQ